MEETSFIGTLKIKKVDLTKSLFEKYQKELFDILVSQYVRKDPVSYTVSSDIIYNYFEEEYKQIFLDDQSYKSGFLYFDENEQLIGTFMMRDAYLICKKHTKELEHRSPTDKFYGYDSELARQSEEIFKLYDIKEGDSIYGTNLAFSPKFLEKFPGKKVLVLIFAVFVDLSQWWENNLKDYKYGIWVQLRQSLYSITMQVFNCVETREFAFIADDSKKYEGKLFLVTKKSLEEHKKIWESFI